MQQNCKGDFNELCFVILAASEGLGWNKKQIRHSDLINYDGQIPS